MEHQVIEHFVTNSCSCVVQSPIVTTVQKREKANNTNHTPTTTANKYGRWWWMLWWVSYFICFAIRNSHERLENLECHFDWQFSRVAYSTRMVGESHLLPKCKYSFHAGAAEKPWPGDWLMHFRHTRRPWLPLQSLTEQKIVSDGLMLELERLLAFGSSLMMWEANECQNCIKRHLRRMFGYFGPQREM